MEGPAKTGASAAASRLCGAPRRQKEEQKKGVSAYKRAQNPVLQDHATGVKVMQALNDVDELLMLDRLQAAPRVLEQVNIQCLCSARFSMQ